MNHLLRRAFVRGTKHAEWRLGAAGGEVANDPASDWDIWCSGQPGYGVRCSVQSHCHFQDLNSKDGVGVYRDAAVRRVRLSLLVPDGLVSGTDNSS